MDAINRINLVLLYGPPGVGKSTFKRNLTDYISFISDQIDLACVSISYDEVIDKNIENFLINSNENETDLDLSDIDKPNWKQGRLLVLKLISDLIDHLNERKTNDFKCESFSSDYLNLISKNFTNCISNQKITNSKYIILLDDLFYYESMRLSLYRLALNKSCGYFVYYFKATHLTFLLERNQNRSLEQKLDESIIENIFNKIEPPKEWEKEYSHCELITNQVQISLTKSFEIILKGLSQFSLHLKQLESQAKCLEEKLQPPEVNKNLIHESDLILRKLISLRLSTSNEKSLLVKKLNKCKLEILNELRLCTSDLSKKLNDLFKSNDKQQIENELKFKLDKIS